MQLGEAVLRMGPRHLADRRHRVWARPWSATLHRGGEDDHGIVKYGRLDWRRMLEIGSSISNSQESRN